MGFLNSDRLATGISHYEYYSSWGKKVLLIGMAILNETKVAQKEQEEIIKYWGLTTEIQRL